MLYFFQLALLISYLSTFSSGAAASPHEPEQAETVFSLSQLAEQPVKPQVWYFEDKTDAVDIVEAQSLFNSGSFQETGSDFNFGFANSSYWVRFAITIQKDSGQSSYAQSNHKDILLEFNYPHLDKIDIYRGEEGSPVEYFLTLGDSYKFSERVVEGSVFIIPDTLQFDKTYQYWVRIETASSLMMLLSVWDKDNYIEAQNRNLIVFGVYYGTLLVMMMYNAFIGISIRDKSYFYYVGYIASFVLFQACLFGHAYQYLWPDYPKINELALPSSILLALFFAIAFSRSFLHTKRNNPVIHTLLTIMLVASISCFVMSMFVGYRISILMAIVLGIPSLISIFSAAINSWRNGVREARIFFMAWVALIVGAVILGLHGLGLVPTNLFTRHSAQVGSAIEVILLSLALADRINGMKAEKRKLEMRTKLELEGKNAELKQALKLLTQNNTLKDEFLATISHELRTPMNGIEGSLQVIQDEIEDEQIKPHVEAATYSANYMTQLVESLLEYSELQSGNWKLHSQPFKLEGIISKCLQMIEGDCLRKGIEFTVKNNAKITQEVVGDYHRIHHMLFQLLDNAIKFTHQGSIGLEITAVDEGEHYGLTFSVSDTGVGISEEKLRDIFESFRQMDGSFSRQYGGLGIGLSLCKAMTDKMEGQISVNSTVGQGTKVDVRINLKKGQDIISGGEAVKKTLPDKPSILIVEDNPVNQMTLTAIVKKFGCEVDTASNGEEAVDMTKEKYYDCILMDCQMPILDGFEATKIIRASDNKNSGTIIIAVTANVMSGDRDKCIASGMDDYIRKPVKKNVIFDQLDSWLEKKRPAKKTA